MTRRRIVALSLVVAAAIGPGCSERPLTQLVVVSDSDLNVPTQLDSVEIEITPPSGAPSIRMGMLETAADLPVSLGVVHRGGELGPVAIVVRGRLGADVIVERHASVFFVLDRTLVVDLPLEASCIDIPCPETETCEHGACRARVLSREELRDFDGTLPRLGDGGTTCTDRPELCNGLDDDCDGMADEGIDLMGDPTHCGACGVVCPSRPHADPACANGLCTVDCRPSYGDCNGDTRDGCEEELTTLSMCMACGASCTAMHATPTCFTGECAIDECAPGWGDCNAMIEDGCEAPLNDPMHCGSCSPCSLPGATESCSGGVCAIRMCDPGQGDCNGMMSDGCEASLTSLTDCGTCGHACATLSHATATCASGVCGVGACDGDYADCDGSVATGCETSLISMTDCGACGAPCALDHASEACTTGTCEVVTCDDGWGDCNGIASDGCERFLETATDCGACGTSCSGTTPLCGRQPSGTRNCTATCTGSTTMCGTGCVDTQTSVAHCGACSRPCAPENAVGECRGGSCSIAACNPGFGDCNGLASDGCETSLSTMANCGGCGMACDLPAAAESCVAGRCVLGACDSGRGDCDGVATNGCEASLTTMSHCGACFAACALPNATETCATGACAIVACDSGRADCDGVAADGCEAMLGTLTDCRACGDACDLPRATESCTGVACQLDACDAGFDDCNGDLDDGCERSLTTPTDCGSCGTPCGPFDNATASCLSGTCAMECLPGWGDCDGMRANGCEEPLNSAAHCGACTTTCSGGTPNCTAGASGYACSGSCGTMTACGTSCVDLMTDEFHCGACDVPCAPPAATGTCVGGACRISSCDPGRADCNAMASDGCERDVTTLTDCGACGTACTAGANATPSCTTGACVAMCMSGFGDCDGMASSGCERALNTTANCGGCGVMCAGSGGGATFSCATGTCTITGCNMNRANCNGVASDGCETTLTTDAMNCGICGMVCPGGQICRMGVCRAS